MGTMTPTIVFVEENKLQLIFEYDDNILLIENGNYDSNDRIC